MHLRSLTHFRNFMHIRSILIALYLIIYAIISLPLYIYVFLLGKIAPKRQRITAQRIVSTAFRGILFISGVKIHAVGIENIPTDKPVLYVANHRGFFDILASYTTVPTPTCFVSKKELEKVPCINHWMMFLKCLFLDRSDIKAGMRTILKGIQQMKDGYSIFIMPEGSRSTTEDMLPFHNGSFKFAQKTGFPIVPVAITNTDKAFEQHLPWIGPADVTIYYGEPFCMQDLEPEKQKHIGRYARSIIQENLDKINSGMIE